MRGPLSGRNIERRQPSSALPFRSVGRSRFRGGRRAGSRAARDHCLHGSLRHSPGSRAPSDFRVAWKNGALVPSVGRRADWAVRSDRRLSSPGNCAGRGWAQISCRLLRAGHSRLPDQGIDRTSSGASSHRGRNTLEQGPTAKSEFMNAEPDKKVFIKTYGCQMNVYDSDRMGDVLAPLGYAATADIHTADLVILNTCHIREKAAEKVYSELGRIRRVKEEKHRRGRSLLIAVAGCVAQAEGEEIIRRAPAVDLVFGPQSYHRLPELLAAARQGGGVVETEFPAEEKFAKLPRKSLHAIARGVAAFVTIQEGCDKFCTFCVVPYTRGAEYSRPVSAIEEEVRSLADAGVREVTLLGQNVNAYRGEAADGRIFGLAHLLDRLAQ